MTNKENMSIYKNLTMLSTAKFLSGFAGYVWGWITIKSRSILLAIVSHNFSNFFGTLSTMIK